MAKRGRPRKYEIIRKWQWKNWRRCTPKRCAADTGIALSTVYKWWTWVRDDDDDDVDDKIDVYRLVGRKSCKGKVQRWVRMNPNGSISECATSLGISRQTAKKWWPKAKKQGEGEKKV